MTDPTPTQIDDGGAAISDTDIVDWIEDHPCRALPFSDPDKNYRWSVMASQKVCYFGTLREAVIFVILAERRTDRSTTDAPK